MGRIRTRTTAFDLDVHTGEGETVLEALRRHNLPAQGLLLFNDDMQFVSLTRVLGAVDTISAYSMRNPDFGILDPTIQLSVSADPVAEIFAADIDQKLTLLQFDRREAIDYIYASFSAVLDNYRRANGPDAVIQVALSGGGDGRIVGECVGRYRDHHPGAQFQAIITANGFEDETAHIEAATTIAVNFGIPYAVYDEAASAKMLGFTDGFASALDRYSNEFPHDEAEILATYWVQELNMEVAKAAGRRAVIFGFNQEDVIAERLYQALTGRILPPYPVRQIRDVDLIAPLYQIPKRMIDALDVENTMRNYQRRTPSVSYLRSSLYFTAYLIAERFPALAAGFADPTILARASEEIPSWLVAAGDQTGPEGTSS
ncbi:hypothetical protein GCM10010123_01680 [Pilimelia anulata]|uniref:Uncharacterized protein n=1 Tax=Pilimelia anulata TaxID=53371 RepID=A0A8J3B6P3_9ACTN|nr:hypothetical protein [Pilimelia anulata]GGJ75330.1 hypothetical protein GCM10010123_01680 [Pilimelia anulata]